MILLLLCSASLHVKKLSQIFLYYYIVHVISCAKGSIIALISLLLETAIFKNDMLDVFLNHNSLIYWIIYGIKREHRIMLLKDIRL